MLGEVGSFKPCPGRCVASILAGVRKTIKGLYYVRLYYAIDLQATVRELGVGR